MKSKYPKKQQASLRQSSTKNNKTKIKVPLVIFRNHSHIWMCVFLYFYCGLCGYDNKATANAILARLSGHSNPKKNKKKIAKTKSTFGNLLAFLAQWRAFAFNPLYMSAFLTSPMFVFCCCSS